MSHGKNQHEVEQLIARPTVFVCDQCVDMLGEIVEKKRGNPNPLIKIKLEEIKQLRADVARLHDGLSRIEQKINEMVKEGEV